MDSNHDKVIPERRTLPPIAFQPTAFYPARDGDAGLGLERMHYPIGGVCL
jgi:hypothetical protein